MLMLRGIGKVDLIFDEPWESSPPWEVSAETLRGIDDHFWDWTIWLAAKDQAGKRELVGTELMKMHEHLLAPLGVAQIPSTIADAVAAYTAARAEAEKRLGFRIPGRWRMKSAGFWQRVGMRSSPPIRAVFLDLDDTLCDTIGTREARAAAGV